MVNYDEKRIKALEEKIKVLQAQQIQYVITDFPKCIEAGRQRNILLWKVFELKRSMVQSNSNYWVKRRRAKEGISTVRAMMPLNLEI